MNLLDLTPRQLKRAAAIKKRITDLKTAKQIGLMIPPAVLARADRIIK